MSVVISMGTNTLQNMTFWVDDRKLSTLILEATLQASTTSGQAAGGSQQVRCCFGRR